MIAAAVQKVSRWPATIRPSRTYFEMRRKLLEGRFAAQHDSDLGDGLGWVTLNQRHRWHRDSYDAPCGDHGTFPDRYVGQ